MTYNCTYCKSYHQELQYTAQLLDSFKTSFYNMQKSEESYKKQVSLQENQLNLSKNTISQLAEQLEKAKNQVKSLAQQKQDTELALAKTKCELIVQTSENEKRKRTIEEQDAEIKTLKEAVLTLQRQNAEMQSLHTQEIAGLNVKHKDEQLKLYERINNFMQNFPTENSHSAYSSGAPSTYTSDNENPPEQ